MTSANALATLLIKQEMRLRALERGSQLGSSTVDDTSGGALAIADVVADAADIIPDVPTLQDAVAQVYAELDTVHDIVTASNAQVDSQLELAATNLAIAADALAASQQQLADSFGARVDGLSADVSGVIVAAGSAQSAADAAAALARSAAGLAATKGKTIVQVTAPSGANADPANLWIDSSGTPPKNTPNRYVDLGPTPIINDAPNPAFRAGLTGYNTEPAIKATQQADGTVRVITTTGAGQSFVVTGVANLTDYTVVVRMRSFQGGTTNMFGANPNGVALALTDAWQVFYLDVTTASQGNLYFAVNSPGSNPTNGFDISNVNLVKGKGYRGPISDGTTPGWSWAGAADASPSSYSGPKWVPVQDATAVTAASTAAQAVTSAKAAQATADQAKAAATTAQGTADTANAAALAAAGIANSKAKVIVQVSAPTGANADPLNLWIDISTDASGSPKNRPNRYNPDTAKWEPVTDKTATDAAAAAAAAAASAKTASDAAAAAQVTADSKPLILFSSSAPSGTAPTGSVWWMLDTSKNIAGQWQQTGTVASPSWSPQLIRSDVIANLDVGKLTAGQAAILDVVAQKIAAGTASIQTVNVGNLFVTDGATMSQAVIDYLFVNVVKAKKITADMIDVNSLSGVTITGATIQSAASGQRVRLSVGGLSFFDQNDVNRGGVAATVGGVQLSSVGADSGSSPSLLLVGKNTQYPNTQFPKVLPFTADVLVGRVHATEVLARDAYRDTAAKIPLNSTDSATGRGLNAQRFNVIVNDDPSDPNATVAVVQLANGLIQVYADSYLDRASGAPLFSDTKWVDVPTIRSGFTGTSFQYRRIGQQVRLRGSIAPTAGGNLSGTTAIATLPAGFRPGIMQYFWGAASTTAWARVAVNADGTIDIAAPSSTTAPYIRMDEVSFFVN